MHVPWRNETVRRAGDLERARRRRKGVFLGEAALALIFLGLWGNSPTGGPLSRAIARGFGPVLEAERAVMDSLTSPAIAFAPIAAPAAAARPRKALESPRIDLTNTPVCRRAFFSPRCSLPVRASMSAVILTTRAIRDAPCKRHYPPLVPRVR